MRRHVVWLAAFVMVGACTDGGSGPGSDAQLTVSWMEWPAAVTASQHGSIRLVGFHGACGKLVLTVEQSGPSGVGVNAVEHFENGAPRYCPAIVAMFDTLLPLPRLVTPTGPSGQFSIDAPSVDNLGGIVRRIFGFVMLSDQQPDATLQVGGRARVLADSLGCSWATPELNTGAGPYVLSTNLTLSGGWHSAFLSGYFQPALSPRCGQDPLLQLRAIEVDPGP